MEAILFHPETSMRRALILALGEYAEGLPAAEREPLIAKLLDALPQRPRCRDPRGGGMDAAAMEARRASSRPPMPS